MNLLTTDGTQSKDGNFTGGSTGKSVSYDAKNKIIKSTVSFKPDQNFLQANSGWVLYINEVVPKELLKYIDTNEVRLGVSTSTGTITASNPIKLTVDPNGNGVISTKDTPASRCRTRSASEARPISTARCATRSHTRRNISSSR